MEIKNILESASESIDRLRTGCLRDGCGTKVEARGLCKKHYFELHTKIRKWDSGLTWKMCEESGLCLPKV